jgi:succinate-semialdehyde dehydrogenase / glutarate-semialdehyde dehydrogenase
MIRKVPQIDWRKKMLTLNDPTLFRQQCLIGGQWVDADDNRTIPVDDPAGTGEVGTIPRMGTDETRRAIGAAQEAQSAWRATTARERALILRQ